MELSPNYEFYPGERGGFLDVDESSCSGCGKCRDFCARGVWEKSGATFKPARQELCVECGACWNVCPAGAVAFGEPEGGTGVIFSFG
jgi:NAD-dependent dihydropyrimidine dehydrogenase PreA subunit